MRLIGMTLLVFVLTLAPSPVQGQEEGEKPNAIRIIRGTLREAGYEEAVSTLRRLSEHRDQYVWDEQALIDLAHMSLYGGWADRALEVLQLVDTVCAGSADVLIALGYNYVALSDRENARECFLKAMEYSPGNAMAQKALRGLDRKLTVMETGTVLEMKYLFDAETEPVGPYLGQQPPGATPEIFAPGIICSELRETMSWIPADGKSIWFSVSVSHTESAVMVTTVSNDQWQSPQQFPLLTDFAIPYLAPSPNEDRLYYSAPGQDAAGTPTDDQDIYFIQRTAEGWSQPVRLPDGVNTTAQDCNPFVSAQGDLYFASNRLGGLGGLDVYCAEYVDGGFREPRNLGESVNSDRTEWDVVVSPTGDFLVVGANRESANSNSFDLFVCFKQEDGSWSEAAILGPEFNTDNTELGTSLSADGKYLFFNSGRERPDAECTGYGNGLADIYWVNTDGIRNLKESVLGKQSPDTKGGSDRD